MSAVEFNAAVSATRAGRALGALFFSAFGGAWLALWAYRTFEHHVAVLVVVAVATVALFAFTYTRYRQHRPALKAEAASPARQRAARMFNMVNATQWVLILVVGNVLANIGLSAWVIPAAIFIIGLHFLPLARVFANRPHFLTGAALMLLAVAYPLLAPGGPNSPAGCLGAGLILWASALWAVTATPSIESTATGGTAARGQT